MREITNNLKKRFAKDTNLPITIFDEPYFSNRLTLLDKQFNSIEKYDEFKKFLKQFESEDDYFKSYNEFKDNVIEYLESNEKMNEFKKLDTSKYKPVNQLTKKDIFNEKNVGKNFISIDMVKGNFTVLKCYDKSIVGNKNNYFQFASMFTDSDYFKQSKYIRQVIFGNIAPKKQVMFQKYLMDKVLTEILEIVPLEKIAFFNTDEIVLENDDLDVEKIENVINSIVKTGLELKIEKFTLKVLETEKSEKLGYLKCLNDGNYDIKCVSKLFYPFVLRFLNSEEITEEDKIFNMKDGSLSVVSKIISVPKIRIREE